MSRCSHRGTFGAEEVPIGHLGNARFRAKEMIFSLTPQTIAQKHGYIFRFGFVISGPSAGEANILQGLGLINIFGQSRSLGLALPFALLYRTENAR